MRTYPGVRVGLFKDPKERQQVKVIDDMLRQVSGALSKAVFPGQQPPANPNPSSTSSIPGGSAAVPVPFLGDTLYGLGAGAWGKLPIGAANTVYVSNGSKPVWTPASTIGVTGATYITQTHDASLSAEQALSDLATGILKSTTGTGVITIAAASDLPTHGAAQHTDRTRTIFIPWQGWTDTGGIAMPVSEAVGTYPDRYTGVPMTGGGGQTRVLSQLIVPQDFTSGTASWKIIYASAGTGTNPVHFDLAYKVVAILGSLTAAADVTMSGNDSPTGTADLLNSFAIGSTVTSLAAGSFVRLALQRDSGHASDTNTDDVDFLGLQLDYTADM